MLSQHATLAKQCNTCKTATLDTAALSLAGVWWKRLVETLAERWIQTLSGVLFSAADAALIRVFVLNMRPVPNSPHPNTALTLPFLDFSPPFHCLINALVTCHPTAISLPASDRPLPFLGRPLPFLDCPLPFHCLFLTVHCPCFAGCLCSTCGRCQTARTRTLRAHWSIAVHSALQCISQPLHVFVLPFTAFPCVYTTFYCTSLPFIVFALSCRVHFTAFPCVCATFQSLSLPFNCVFTASECISRFSCFALPLRESTRCSTAWPAGTTTTTASSSRRSVPDP